ncbi:TPA: phage tail protein [Stenotrophomonas maltophilia]|nr:phage tail protein [Stenotrophomonas maltophilia]HEL4860694.1 phage tail protein [Stenotrophomonas maltophilia]HEL7632446.1 phage tail protein [Stenotrophomonas maltophilia]HEL7636213.1 phage tail protein [Stenotrophomonas maltophilia]
MTDTFSWVPTRTGGGTANSVVRRAKFGDGYSQSTPDGLNARWRSYQLTFTGSQQRIDQIIEFLDAHVGRSFYWQSPRGLLLFHCDTHSEPLPTGLVHSITVTFEQTFQP